MPSSSSTASAGRTKSAAAMLSRRWRSEEVPGITTIILLILGVGGIQLFSLSIIGDYIGKILEEAKARPRFIRSKLLLGNEVLNSPREISRFVAERESLRRSGPS